jgi:hypothetical protein
MGDGASWIPAEWDDVTPEWMTSALQRAFADWDSPQALDRLGV